MKLTEIKDENALQALADIIEPAGEIFSDKEVTETYKENKLKAISLAIKNHKKAIITILATLDEEKVENYHINFLSLPMKLMEIVNDEDMMNLFLSLETTAEKTSYTPYSTNEKQEASKKSTESQLLESTKKEKEIPTKSTSPTV